ncbi:MAG: glycosyltransferase family 2 protein, partial [Bacteroidota bacterium]
ESLSELAGWIERVVKKEGLSYEIIFVDDGSIDGSWQEIEILSQRDPHIKGIKFRTNYGKSAALNRGFDLTSGEVVITMDADLQDSPDEIPMLYRMVRLDGYDIVSGWKKKRRDPLGKRWPSKFFNWTTRRISGLKLHDFNCGLKAYKKEVIKSIEIYGEMHRYIPVIARWAGFRKITEKVVNHQKRKYGKSKFGASRLIKGFLDLVSLTFVTRFGKRPMHFFGVIGILLFIAGLAIALYLTWAKLFMLEYKMTERPLFYFGLLAMIMGTQVFVAGFVADLISRNSSRRDDYLIEKTIVKQQRKQQWNKQDKKPDNRQAQKTPRPQARPERKSSGRPQPQKQPAESKQRDQQQNQDQQKKQDQPQKQDQQDQQQKRRSSRGRRRPSGQQQTPGQEGKPQPPQQGDQDNKNQS